MHGHMNVKFDIQTFCVFFFFPTFSAHVLRKISKMSANFFPSLNSINRL